MLLKKDRGRVDLHLAVLFTVEVVFRQGAGVVAAAARLFAAFGVEEQVRELFCINFDPLKVHSHLMSVTSADHLSIFADGRAEYEQILGVKLPEPFVSNASDNVCFLEPYAVAQPQSGPLPDMPSWTLRGSFTNVQALALEGYRVRARDARREREPALSPVGDILQFLAPLAPLAALAGSAGASLAAGARGTLDSCTRIHVAGPKETFAADAAPVPHGLVDPVSPPLVLGASPFEHPTQSLAAFQQAPIYSLAGP